MCYLCEMYHKPITEQYCIADAVSWVSEQILLGLRTKLNLIDVFLEWNSVICRGLIVFLCNP